MTRPIRSEAEEIIRIANEYKQRGYRTIVQPSSDDLPDFLQSLRPDLVAFGKDESVVFEIKVNEPSAGDTKLQALARAVDARSGWRFELVHVGKRRSSGAESNVAGLAPMVISEAWALLAVAKKLVPSQPNAALILSWSVVEAAVRRFLQNADSQPRTGNMPTIFRQAYTSGLISWSELKSILKHLQTRNALVHGLNVGKNGKAARSVVTLATRLLKRLR
jgi:hypothetical protein